MRSHLQFSSTAFSPYPGEEEVNPGIFGKRLAEHLAKRLPAHGLAVAEDLIPEDWGWQVQLEGQPFPVWIGCANYEDLANGFLCFVEPSKPFVRRWFKKFDTRETVERVAAAIETILKESGEVQQMRWWTEEEVRQQPSR
jgi:hypothetical protein